LPSAQRHADLNVFEIEEAGFSTQARKDAGRRNESYDGLLFPPERGKHLSSHEFRKIFFIFFRLIAFLVKNANFFVNRTGSIRPLNKPRPRRES